MQLKADVLNSYKKINETFIDTLLDDPPGVLTVHDFSVYPVW